MEDRFGRQNAERDRKVERGPGLAHVGRGEIDRHPVGGEVESGVPDGRADAVPALADARIGQTDHAKEGESEADVDLDMYRIGLYSEDRGALESGEHAPACWCKRATGRRARVSPFRATNGFASGR